MFNTKFLATFLVTTFVFYCPLETQAEIISIFRDNTTCPNYEVMSHTVFNGVVLPNMANIPSLGFLLCPEMSEFREIKG